MSVNQPAKTILLIEDHPQMLRSVATILEMEGFGVRTASNGLHGLEAARREKPDLILCDVAMPVMDGFETLRQIRQTEGLANVPFIFITARTEREDQRTGMNLGADDYVTKPVSRDELLKAIHSRLELIQRREKAGQSGFRPDFSSAQPLVDRLGLTPREAEVLLWVAQGKSNADIATILGMAEKTVKKHMTSIFEKLGLEGRNAATIAALEVLSGGGNG